jgi:hypothetical protein
MWRRGDAAATLWRARHHGHGAIVVQALRDASCPTGRRRGARLWRRTARPDRGRAATFAVPVTVPVVAGDAHEQMVVGRGWT